MLIHREKIKTETGRRYYDILQKLFWDEEYLVVGLFTRLRSDEKRQKMIDFIESGHTDAVDVIEQSRIIAHEDE